MAIEFEVSYRKAIEQNAQYMGTLDKLAGMFDRIGIDMVKLANAFETSGIAFDRGLGRQAYRQLRAFGMGAKDAREAIELLSQSLRTQDRNMQNMVRQYMDATARATALAKGVGGVSEALRDTANARTYVRWQEKITAQMEELKGRLEYARHEFVLLGSEEANELARMSQLVKGRKAELEAIGQQTNRIEALQRQLDELNSAEGREEQLLKQSVAARRAAITFLEKQAASTAELQRNINFLNSAEGQQQQRLKQEYAARRAAITSAEQQSAATAELQRQYTFLNSTEGQEQQQLRQSIAARKAAITFVGDQAAATAALQRQSEFLESEEGKEQQQLRQSIAARKSAITFLEQQASATSRLQQMVSFLESAEGKEQQALREQVTALRGANAERERQAAAEAKALEATRLHTAEEAKAASQYNQSVAAAKAYNAQIERNALSEQRATNSTAQYVQTMQRLTASMGSSSSGAVNQQLADLSRYGRDATNSLQALTQAQARENAEEARLTRQLDQINRQTQARARITQGSTREIRAAEEATARETRQLEQLARVSQMSTRELLGLETANQRLARSMGVANQGAAGFRAMLSGMRSSFGSYTSATILTATAVYGIASSLRYTMSVGMEFEQTMSKVQAVMLSGNDILGNSDKRMSIVEGRVRSLAATTKYTATEVGDGMFQLGQAGLSAGDAMEALPAALNLASVGMVSMGESADIATNIMTSFNLKASDLSDVVDVMASAATNSNTTVDQMANAISYVGPAAEIAGYSLRDVTAAIEVMANSGIRGSRAGTGLRRMMQSLSAPTQKGVEVLNKYGIAMKDAEGNTRSMQDVLKQFHDAMFADGVEPTQALADITATFGTYASTAMTALIKNADGFGEIRRQLDDTTGSADKMRKTMEDNLPTDIQNVKSAFQDLAQSAFKEFSPILREYAVSLQNWMVQLGAAGEDGTSALTPLLDRIYRIGKASAALLAAWAGFKVASSFASGMKGLSESIGVASSRMTVLTARTRTAAATMKSFDLATMASGFRTLGGALNTATWSMRALGTAAVAGVAGLAVVGEVLAPIIAVGGALYGLYSLFNDDTPIKKNQNEIENLRQSYLRYKGAINTTAEQQQRRSLQDNINTLQESVDKYKEMLEALQESGAKTQTATDAEQDLKDAISSATAEMESNKKALLDLDGTPDAAAGRTASYVAWTKELSDNNKQQAVLEEKLKNASSAGMGGVKVLYDLTTQVEALRNRNVELTASIFNLGVEAEQAQGKVVSMYDRGAEAMAKYTKEQRDANLVARMNATEANRYWQAQAEADKQAVLSAKNGTDEQDRLIDKWKESSKKAEQAQYTLSKVQKDVIDNYQDIDFNNLAPTDKINAARKALSGVNKELEVTRMQIASDKVTGKNTVDWDRTKYLQQRRKELESILKSGVTANTKAGNAALREQSKAQQQLNKDLQTYQKLVDDYNPAEKVINDSAKQSQAVERLRQQGKITQEESDRARKQIGENLAENLRQYDEYYSNLKKLRDKYMADPYNGAIEDYYNAVQNPKTRVRGAEGDQIKKQIQNSMNKTTDGMVDYADVPMFGNGNGQVDGDYSDYINKQIDILQAQKKYRDAREELYNSQTYHTADDATAQGSATGASAEQQALLQQQATEQQQNMALQADSAVTLAGVPLDQRLDAYQEYYSKQLEMHKTQNDQIARLDQTQASASRLMNDQAKIAMVKTGETAVGQLADMLSQGSALQKVAFLAQKGMAVAQILMSGQVAAAAAMEPPPVGLGYKGSGLASMIKANAIASAAVVSAQTFTAMATGNTGGTNYQGAKDKGGNVTKDGWAVVGEYGPEIVRGPANVTSRKDTARLITDAAGGGGSTVNFSPNITVQVQGGGDGTQNNQELGKMIGAQVSTKVHQVLQEQMRHGGVLFNFVRGR